MFNTPPVLSKFASDTISFCEGNVVDLNAIGTGSEFVWKLNGKQIPKSKKSNIKITAAGLYTVVNSNGTCQDSTSVYLLSNPKPTKPIITANADTLIAVSNGNVYAWYFNNQLIPNATISRFIAQSSGNYKVVVSNSTNCSDTSNDYIFIKSSVSELSGDAIKLFPNPTTNVAKLDLNITANWLVNISDMNGHSSVQICHIFHFLLCNAND